MIIRVDMLRLDMINHMQVFTAGLMLQLNADRVTKIGLLGLNFWEFLSCDYNLS